MPRPNLEGGAAFQKIKGAATSYRKFAYLGHYIFENTPVTQVVIQDTIACDKMQLEIF